MLKIGNHEQSHLHTKAVAEWKMFIWLLYKQEPWSWSAAGESKMEHNRAVLNFNLFTCQVEFSCREGSKEDWGEFLDVFSTYDTTLTKLLTLSRGEEKYTSPQIQNDSLLHLPSKYKKQLSINYIAGYNSSLFSYLSLFLVLIKESKVVEHYNNM